MFDDCQIFLAGDMEGIAAVSHDEPPFMELVARFLQIERGEVGANRGHRVVRLRVGVRGDPANDNEWQCGRASVLSAPRFQTNGASARRCGGVQKAEAEDLNERPTWHTDPRRVGLAPATAMTDRRRRGKATRH